MKGSTMKRYIYALFVLVFLGFGLGCKSTAKNQAEVGFRWGTEVTFFSRAAQTSPEAATYEVTSTVVDELLKTTAKPAEPAEPVTSDGG